MKKGLKVLFTKRGIFRNPFVIRTFGGNFFFLKDVKVKVFKALTFNQIVDLKQVN